MANEWQSLLPSAWKPQDPNTQVQAAKAGAETALTHAQTATQAVDAVARNQERIRKQALQDVIAKSVRTTLGPDGKLIKVIDQDRFFEAMSKSPAAADAYDKFVSTAYPQMQREAVQRGLSAAVTPEGGVDQAKVAAAAQRSPFGASIVSEAAAQQKQRLGEAAAQAGDLTTIGAMTTSPEGAARPGTLVGNTQMQPRVLGTPTAGGAAAADRVSASVVAQLSDAGRESVLYNLKAKGIALPKTASDADIAAAINRVADAAVASESVAGADLQKPISLATSVFQTAAREPSIRQKVQGEILGGALDYTGKKISTEKADVDLDLTKKAQKEIDQLIRQGYNATTSNAAAILENKAKIDWLNETRHSVREVKSQIKQGKTLDPDTFNNKLNTWLNAPQAAESITTESGRDKFLSGLRPIKSLGAVLNESRDIKDVVRALTAQNLGAQDQVVVLEHLDKILSEQLVSGQAVNKDKQYRSKNLKPSVFGKDKAGEVPNTQRSNKRGML